MDNKISKKENNNAITGKNNADKLFEIYKANSGAFNGAIIGLIVAVVFLILGVLKTIFIALSVGIGYYIGNRLSEDKNYITSLLDRILPPGTYR